MTDQHEPKQPRPAGRPAGDGVPVAGRKPEAPRKPVGDGPTVPLKRPERKPPPVAEEPSLGERKPPPAAEEPASGGRKPRPAAEEPSLGERKPPPVAEEPGLVGRKPLPADEEPTAVSPAAVPDGGSAVVPPEPVDRGPVTGHQPEADDGARADHESTTDGEVTSLLTPAAGEAPQAGPGTAGTVPDGEPAMTDPAGEQARRPDLEGETQRLRPPAVVPGAAVDGERREPSASPEPVNGGADAGPEPSVAPSRLPQAETAASEAGPVDPRPVQSPARRMSSAGALIWVLLALFGFTLVVQLRSNDTDEGLASARQEDLVRILSDLEAQDTRLQAEIAALENSQRQLNSGVLGRQAALAEAEKRADELGLLAGTMPGRGPGLQIVVGGVKASSILNAVQELRGAGGEVMQLAGTTGAAVRIVASTYFVDAEGGGIVVDGTRLTGPWTLSVIGPPQTMETALQIPGGVVASVKGDGGSVTMKQRDAVEVTATRRATSLQYARPVS